MAKGRSITLHEAAERYLEEKRTHVKAATFEKDKFCIEAFLAEAGNARGLDGKGDLYLIEALAKKVQRYVDGLAKSGMKPSTMRWRLTEVSSVFRWCVHHGYLMANPFKFVRMPRKQKPVLPIYTLEEYHRIVAAAKGTLMQWLVVCAFRTGYSMVDICNLKWEHVDLESMIISKTRQKMERCGLPPVVVPIFTGSDLHQHLLALKEVPDTDDWPGPGYVHHELASLYQGSQHRVSTRYMLLMNKLGIRKPFKSWRNTYISALANSGAPTSIACKMSGHTNPAMLAHYVVPDIAALRDAAIRANEFMERKHEKEIKLTPKT